MGNGKLGSMVSVAADGVTLQVSVDSSAVWDDRPLGAPYSASPDWMGCNRPRLPVGNLVLDGFEIDTTSFGMRLNLWDAEVRGSAEDTDAADGAIAWRVFAHAVYGQADVVVVELNHTSTTGIDTPGWRFVPAVAMSPRSQSERACHGLYTAWPNPNVSTTTARPDGAQVYTQAHLRGTEHATAVLAVQGAPVATPTGTRTTTTLYVSTSSVLDRGAGSAAALAAVRAAAAAGLAGLTASHRAWWHAYYPAGGFVTLADAVVESFYWVQMYKIASATRADRELYDLMGPWGVQPTSWPDVHWDLNLQLTHWVFFTSNRVGMVRSLTSRLEANFQTLVDNVPPAWRLDAAAGPPDASSPDMRASCGPIPGLYHNGTCLTAPETNATRQRGKNAGATVTGNLLWVMQQWHNVYRYTGYATAELEALYPLLARAVTYYKYITRTAGGVLHIARTVSPEYGAAEDCNYDVALLRWGLGVLLDAAHKGFQPAATDARLSTWEAMAAALVPYQTDAATGFLIGKGVPLAHGYAPCAVQFYPHGGQSRFRPALRTYDAPPCGPSVRVVS